ncbi:hypothetical protein OH76DRAFT_1486014 [Lentinus brumalis]|uniref:Uncharacterized protein n=1 Tax=Lentinus brumalis TaxID=2498619 RepID=A0A371CZZ4_9APHY|nr:hypothetical protein OH76DRAFT_1486014 [Polyporus brumalis]
MQACRLARCPLPDTGDPRAISLVLASVKAEKVKTEKEVKAEKKVKTEKKVKEEKTKKSAHTVKKEKMLYPEKGSAIIRNSKKRTHWFKSVFHKALPKPPMELKPRPSHHLWVHHYDVNKKQIWMWDEVSGEESEGGTPKYDWKKVREGIAHPHPSLNATHVMHIVDDGTPRWVLARSRRERLIRKKRDLVPDIDISDD